MKKTSFLLIISLISSFSLSLYGQADFKDGFIITPDNDTLYGQIDFRGNMYNSEICRFKTGEQEEIKEYKPGEISGYMLSEGRFFITKEVEILVDKENNIKQKINAFLECLVDGKADLYYLVRFKEEMYFIEKDGKIYQLSNTTRTYTKNYQTFSVLNEEYKGILIYNLQESPELKDRITNMPLTQNNLVKITQKYHDNVCPDERCTVYVKNKTKTIIAVGPSLVYNFNRLQMSNENINSDITEETMSSSALSGGLNIDLINSGKFERLVISFQCVYLRNSYKTSFDGRYKSTLVFNTNSYISTLTLGYKYPRYKFKPYCALGLTYYKTVSGTSQVESQNYHYQVEKEFILPAITVGILYSLGKKLYLKVEPVYAPIVIFNKCLDHEMPCKISNLNCSFSILYLINGINK